MANITTNIKSRFYTNAQINFVSEPGFKTHFQKKRIPAPLNLYLSYQSLSISQLLANWHPALFHIIIVSLTLFVKFLTVAGVKAQRLWCFFSSAEHSLTLLISVVFCFITRICAAEMAVRYVALCRKVHVCHCNSLGGATWRSLTGRTDSQTDGQTECDAICGPS